MKETRKYKIITAGNYNNSPDGAFIALEEKVNEAIQDYYFPLGGPFHYKTISENYLAQAMIYNPTETVTIDFKPCRLDKNI